MTAWKSRSIRREGSQTVVNRKFTQPQGIYALSSKSLLVQGAANVRNPPILWKNNVLLAQKVVR